MSSDQKKDTKLTPEQQDRVTEALPMLENIVRLARRFYPNANVDDARSAGAEALSRLARRYDRSKNNSFKGYAWRRTFYAVMDRARGDLPIQDTVLAAAMKAGLKAAKILKDETDEFSGSDDDFAQHVASSCDVVAAGSALGLRDELAALGEDGLIRLVDYRQYMAVIDGAVASWSAEEHQVLELRFRQRMTAQRVARELGISKATVDRRCRKLIARLRQALESEGLTEMPFL